jgi:GNAT superfamily N-acetyltransferase
MPRFGLTTRGPSNLLLPVNIVWSVIISTVVEDSMITYHPEPDLAAGEFIDLLVRATLADRRPVDRPDIIRAMLKHADIILTARREKQLVGVARAITDFSYCTYLSDLAVDQAHWRQGIGRELIRQTHEMAGVQTHLILLAAPSARTYYPHIGMKPHDSAWIVRGRPPE